MDRPRQRRRHRPGGRGGPGRRHGAARPERAPADPRRRRQLTEQRRSRPARPAAPLAGSGGRKPVDVGNGTLAASLGWSNAALLSLVATHPRHGVVELSAAPPFDETARGSPSATRAHRSLLADDGQACAWLDSDAGAFEADEIDLSDACRPRWRGRLGPVTVEAAASAGTEGVEIAWRLACAGEPPALRLRVRGRLDRPALAEITEIAPPPPTGARTALLAVGRRLRLTAARLPARAELVAGGGAWRVEGQDATLAVEWPSGAREHRLALRCALEGVGLPGRGPCPVGWPGDPTRPRRLAIPRRLERAVRSIVERAIVYVRGCTALALRADERAFLADHRLLPLSWTRDAYWQALLLLATGDEADVDRVADHLRWLWRRCERPDGRWVRSHHANGRRKDRAFQADQQLYPLVELADWWRAVGRLPDGVAWADEVPRAWEVARRATDEATGLIASEENAADDPADAPYIASTQILLWYAARRAAELAAAVPIGLAPGELLEAAARARAAFDRHIVEGMWAYATDGAGARVGYHDANDLPTALAPLLGFCAADDAAWRATMRFAFSPDNPGAVRDDAGALGSAHTPGAWTLGDVQAWVVSSLAGDVAGAGAALDRLAGSAFGDGMLPEAYMRMGGSGSEAGRVRHWFAWPAAALGALALLDARGLLEERLAARSTP